MTPKRCTCAEAYYIDKQGRTKYFKGQHDCQYIAKRNSLIPEAERRANLATKHERGTLLHAQSWARAFNAVMAELMGHNVNP